MDAIEKPQEKQILSEIGGSTKLKEVPAPTPSHIDIKEPIVYDYMKYPSKKKGKTLHPHPKVKKSVSFKRVVELVTFTDDWKMQTSESNLRTEDQQLGNNMRRNF
ncbi:uncharacterized protein [Drosophila virilis]|uniref:Uncharacterized protein n=1 Tax=Drosophila virilis TaxID=7244 RepID=B4LIQ1_DROVI|nr:uncharacterized protein LOC6627214 [Drosophila virilis]EDW61404.1 uncharacterized protein Dvir_GJ20322 [Drosophila virilis]